MKIFLFSLVFISGFTFAQGPQISVKTQFDTYKIEQLSAKILKGDEQVIDLYPIMKLNDEYFVSFVGKKVSGARLDNQEGIFYGKEVGDILSVRVRLDKLNSIQNIEGLAFLELAGKIKKSLDKVLWDTRVDSVHAGYGLPEGYSGKDVFIGITDWGFDYSSPMFYDTSLTYTRIHSAWDQFKLSGPAPVGYNYGTVYNTPAQFVAQGADTANIYSFATHGSHVAGIAGGSGAGLQYRGMAFESQFLFTTFLVDEAAVLDAWQWMKSIADAEGKRLVMNMSWGLYHFGTNDGTSLLSQAITAMSNDGVVFATSAGNNGDVNFHLKKDFNNDSIRSAVAFYNYNSNPNMWGQSLHAWGEVGQDFEMKIELVNSSNQLLIACPYIPASFNGYIDTFMISGIDTVWYNVTAQTAHPQNNRPTIRFRVKKTNTQLKIIMNAKAATGRVHFWNVTELVTDVGNWGMSFLTAGAGTVGGDHFYGIGEPAASGSCISVAAHTSSYVLANGQTYGGAGGNVSSIGPRYDEVLKPDISAPGVGVRSSISSYTDNNYSPTTTVFFNGRTYPFAAFSGTSMSSPAVAGICALLLEANPYLSAEQVKDIIIQTRRLDNNTGNIGPNGDTEWGHGKINAYAAIQLALQTVGIEEPKIETKWLVYPNPAADLIQIEGVEGIENVHEVSIIDAPGKVSTLEMNSGGITISNLSTGNYIVRFILNGKVLQSKFVKF